MARHLYVDPSKFRAPLNYPNLTLTGLGEALQKTWPKGRSYVDVSRFEAPYLSYEFQNNSLFGLGDPMPTQPLPDDLQSYLKTGMPMGTMKRDLGSALAQVPRLVWGIFAMGAGYMTYKVYKLYKSEMPKRHGGSSQGDNTG
jgi:hypothetical protein